MSTRTIVLYADPADPVARIGGENGIDLCHIDAFLPFTRVHGWPVLLDIELPDAFRQQFQGARVVNRLFSLTGTQTDTFLRSNGVDARWLHIRLQALLDQAASICHDTGVRGVSRTLMPLNVQWFEMKRVLPDIATPDFCYAIGYEPPDLSDLVDPMQKSVWSLFDWKQERNLGQDERSRHQFFVSRPRGTPLVSYFCGTESAGIHFPRGEAIAVDHRRVQAINQAARNAFRSEMGEVLIYADDLQLRFHAFSPHLLSVAEEPEMIDMLGRWLAPNDHFTGSADAARAFVH